jgi:hypothetical protein
MLIERRRLAHGYLMNIYWIDDKGKGKNTTEGWSRVPKEFS